MKSEPKDSIFGGSSGAWLVVGITATILMAVAILGGISSERQHVRYAAGACLNNLRQIDGAKNTWALETKADSNAVPTWENIRRYLGRGLEGEIPQCPQGGHYTLGNLQTAPTCSIKGHTLE